MNLNVDFTMSFLDSIDPYIFEIPTYVQVGLILGVLGTTILISQWNKFKLNYITFFGLEPNEWVHE